MTLALTEYDIERLRCSGAIGFRPPPTIDPDIIKRQILNERNRIRMANWRKNNPEEAKRQTREHVRNYKLRKRLERQQTTP